MKKLMLSMFALCAFAQTAHAQEYVSFDNDESNYSEEAEMNQDAAALIGEDAAAYGRGDGWGRPGRGGGWGPRPGRPGPGPRPGPGHGGPGHGGGHGPGYPPPPPGHGGPGHGGPGYPPSHPRVEYVTCESYGNRYNTCYVNPYGIRRVFLARQNSNARCDANRSFGLAGNYIWVDHGCRGVFGVERY
ncbi:DUF3011 domain-containing protein [Bdellovibrio sp. SKB1291214]|uniref:DUF3011 domain-containing protein n=1 Tax=Bdellovibrio sp. SKB1291214 TaxID=1732569 RepID=UPI000B51901C|nr:DUF3011 domain-containing protein [Bdellovibrio sp. SKB1291214]UYL09783.1 DUF3011 domain-containing protein [Bdellovibrio sp. SKB1291214]